MSRTPPVTVESISIPAVCFVDDLCRALRMSRSTYNRLHRARALPIQPLPSFDKHLRWSGADVQRFLESQADSPARAPWGKRRA